MARGECNRCGKEAELIHIYDDEDICEACLDSDFEQCDICGQYWEIGYVDVDLIGDQFVCEYCAEEMKDEDEDEEEE